VERELAEWFKMEIGSRQGDPISPLMFITLVREGNGEGGE